VAFLGDYQGYLQADPFGGYDGLYATGRVAKLVCWAHARRVDQVGNGIDLVKRIKDRDERVRILVWSMHSESLYAERALRNGALGYITKDQATDRIVEAIRRVLAGKVWLGEAMTERLLQQAVGEVRQEATRSPLDALADRELEVFRLIGQGIKTAEIAERLHLSVKTVETYRDRIRQKLDLDDGTKLAHYATRWVLENG
jgi:DNA-binding NarL/FixJ family response regulator